MKIEYHRSILWFYMLTVIMVIVSVAALVSAISWINKPFPGFLTYLDGYVGTYRSGDWPGMKAGLVYLDRVVEVDGQPITGGRELLQSVRQKAPGTPVVYTVESNGHLRQVTVPVTHFQFNDFFKTVLFTYLGGIILFILGFIVYLLKPDTPASWAFLLLCFFLGTYHGYGL